MTDELEEALSKSYRTVAPINVYIWDHDEHTDLYAVLCAKWITTKQKYEYSILDGKLFNSGDEASDYMFGTISEAIIKDD